jgi:hypothetical protein
MLDSLTDRGAWLGWVGIASLVTFVLSLILLPVLVVRMPADYFVTRGNASQSAAHRSHPVGRLIGGIAKNVLGAVFVLAGLAMLLLPGQGLVTILIGITLLDFPGKRGIELRIVRNRAVRSAINWIRSRAGKPPLIIPED